jgi:hypothetical protein
MVLIHPLYTSRNTNVLRRHTHVGKKMLFVMNIMVRIKISESTTILLRRKKSYLQ